jgi:hypothetical protein
MTPGKERDSVGGEWWWWWWGEGWKWLNRARGRSCLMIYTYTGDDDKLACIVSYIVLSLFIYVHGNMLWKIKTTERVDSNVYLTGGHVYNQYTIFVKQTGSHNLISPVFFPILWECCCCCVCSSSSMCCNHIIKKRQFPIARSLAHVYMERERETNNSQGLSLMFVSPPKSYDPWFLSLVYSQFLWAQRTQ